MGSATKQCKEEEGRKGYGKMEFWNWRRRVTVPLYNQVVGGNY